MKRIVQNLEHLGSGAKFGGFLGGYDAMASAVQTLSDEWGKDLADRSIIRIVLHKSCANDSDCVCVSKGGGVEMHFNTARIDGYSRQKLLRKCSSKGIMIEEQ